MPIEPVSAALGIGGSIISGILGGAAAKKAKRAAKRKAAKLSRKLEFLENNRQEILNPYEGISDLSSMATDRSGQMSNAYANLSVATKAAEMQIEEADIAQFVFNQTEKREDAKIDRVAGQLDNAQAAMAQAQADGTAALTGMIGGATSSLAAAYEPE